MAKRKATKKAKRGGGRGEERGLMSSAGLMRYYDVEESAVKLSPKTILLVGVFIGVVVLGLEIYFGIWPA
ncbi:MAG: preprotein translocase subunit Sec61beta [Methanophagales archaeon]|nr:preprotein translocase subunit Sec61beta [Methanophagales archaeon]MCW3141441.1 preprotein translocase subunit Sec61beta [Methanophagales archaeon]